MAINIDLSKVQDNVIYKPGGIVEVGGYFKVGTSDYGISAFQDVSPYNSLGYSDTKYPYAYPEHHGGDFACSEGTPIYAIKDGKLTGHSFEAAGFGNYFSALIGGIEFFFGHLKNSVSTKSFKKGEIVAYTGNTGKSGGPHLHIDARKPGTREFYNLLGLSQIYLSGSNSTPSPEPTPPPTTNSGTTTFTKYYSGGWKSENVTLNNSNFSTEIDTAKYGSGSVKLNIAEDGWLAGTRFSNGSSSSTPPPMNTAKKMTQYYYDGIWNNDSTLTVKSDSSYLKKETDTNKYGSNSYIVINSVDGFAVNTRLR
jgi:hypothetical protein